MNGFTNIYFENRQSTSPARANRYTGEVFLNSNVWKFLTPEKRFFVLLHELGHLKHNTTDELYADHSAFYDYVKKNKSLKESVKALSQVLTFDNPEHYTRLMIQLKRALKYDFEHNHNHNAMKVLDKLQEAHEQKNTNRDVLVGEVEFCQNNDCYTEFLGMGKAAKARREATRTQKLDAKQLRIETRKKGGGFGDKLLDLGKGIVNAVGGKATTTDDSGEPVPVPPNKTGLIITIVIVFVIVVAIVLLATGAFKKKKT